MAGRGAVRSSARLSDTQAPAPAPAPAARPARGRPPAGTAAAAERRARAAERAREVQDSPRVLRDKCRRLARALRNAKHLVVYTGAGISTAADIPDYRGPDGVWTRLRRGEAPARVDVARARPTFTHMALSALWARGLLKFVVSQNCDGLHLRAGLPRRALAELHGDMFAELCAACRRVYLRAFDTTGRTARHRHATRRLCHACGAELRDSIVHFGERGRAAWPLNWAGALRHAARADVVLCLGSSLKVLRRYPRLWRMASAPAARPALYIVNLQWTPKDAAAALKINARCDDVMREVARRLRLRVPRYRAERDPVLAHAEPLAPAEAHTVRAPLAWPAEPAPRSPRSPEYWEASSPSASDSDDELPLRRLAERLRAPPPAPPPAPPAPDPLRAFQVSLQACEATILLRAEHAPAALAPRPSDLRRFRRQRAAPAPPPPAHPALLNGDAALEPVNGTAGLDSRLRRLLEYEPRIEAAGDGKRAPQRRRSTDATAPAPGAREAEVDTRAEGPDARVEPLAWAVSPPWTELRAEPKAELKMEPRTVLKMEPRTVLKMEPKTILRMEPRTVPKMEPRTVLKMEPRTVLKMEPRMALKMEPKTVLKMEPKMDPRAEPRMEPAAEPKIELGTEPAAEAGDSSSSESAGALAAGSLAAAIIRRAVLLCRASLYPGLHTILAPAAPAPPECAWCARERGARRCLWYGPPRATPPAARAWRRVRGRRYLCACCGAGAASPGAAPAEPAGGGWYGKGYRKGRRRR